MKTTDKVMKILYLENEIKLQRVIIQSSYNDYEIDKAYFKLDYLPEKLEKAIKELSSAEIDALNNERKIAEREIY